MTHGELWGFSPINQLHGSKNIHCDCKGCSSSSRQSGHYHGLFYPIWVPDEPGTNSVGVWSKINIKECGILYFLTLWVVWWLSTFCFFSDVLWNYNFTSSCSSFLRPILLNKLCVRNEDLRSMHPSSISGCRSIKPCATAITTDLETTPPQERTT